jgi:hypothetical protein
METNLAESGEAGRCDERHFMTGYSLATGLQKLVLFNIACQILDHEAQTIAKQRLIFLVKRIVTYAQENLQASPMLAEVIRALTQIFPLISDIYGSHWNDAFELLLDFWSRLGFLSSSSPQSEVQLTSLHASLKLLALLRKLRAEEEPNDDLVDAWNDYASQLPQALLHIAKRSQSMSDINNQPVRMVHELLVRELLANPQGTTDSIEEVRSLGNLRSLVLTLSSSIPYSLPNHHQSKLSHMNCYTRRSRRSRNRSPSMRHWRRKRRPCQMSYYQSFSRHLAHHS